MTHGQGAIAKARSPDMWNDARRLGWATGAVVAALTLAQVAVAAPPSARALETTLLAPCCYGGTLDVHDSPIARELRLEIEDRVHRGESTASIEADLVSRYGPQIRAMPHPALFSAAIGVTMTLIVAGAVLVVVLFGRWGPRGPLEVTVMPPDEYDDRVDAELDTME